ncbi:hypothetical protein KKC22_12630 [Myxococcota bacterium]|nr:hypothetical protein [Myxococcota bacterium]MBU1558165.1 hypothetical protein [Patescibacteria group bacterium]
MRNKIIIVLGFLLLSGGSYGNPETYRDSPLDSNDSDLSVCLTRMEKLEDRLDDLEDSLSSAPGKMDIPNARHIQKSNVADREYIIDTPEGCKMWVELNQVYFQGCNVHIVNSSGLGGTEDKGDGLGNLILGNNVCPMTNTNCRQYHPGYTQPGDPVDSERQGSHNIIVGNGHTWSEDAVNSVVFGLENHVKGPNASILGGF